MRRRAVGRARAFGAARARDPQRRTRRLADESPRAAEGPTAACSRNCRCLADVGHREDRNVLVTESRGYLVRVHFFGLGRGQLFWFGGGAEQAACVFIGSGERDDERVSVEHVRSELFVVGGEHALGCSAGDGHAPKQR